MKSVHIRSYSGPYFPTFGLNTERYSVSLRIQSDTGKYEPEITPHLDTSHTVTCTRQPCASTSLIAEKLIANASQLSSRILENTCSGCKKILFHPTSNITYKLISEFQSDDLGQGEAASIRAASYKKGTQFSAFFCSL